MSRVSVIMPAFNAAKYIAQSINSVRQQTFLDWELIVIDDGSTDSTASIVKELQKEDSRVHYFYQSNKKQAAARNLGVKHCTGDWVAFLDADDLWEPTKLAMQQKCAKERDADVFFTGGYIIDESDQLITEYNTISGYYSGTEMYKKLFFSNPVPILSVMLKRSWIDEIGGQDESLNIAGCEDWDYWIRLANNGARFYGLNEMLFKYRINPHGTSRKVLQMRAAECYALFKNLDLTYFNDQEQFNVKQRFGDLIRFIIDSSYKSGKFQEVPGYLELLRAINNGSKYSIAKVVHKLLGTWSRKLVNFILYH